MRIPYNLVPAVAPEQRQAQMRHAVALGFPLLGRTRPDDKARVSIACYGPSLADTWETLAADQRAGVPIISVSGALKFLHERGVTPEYHVDMDPRGYKVRFIDPPVDGVKYVMASVCHPDTWKVLRHQDVTLWHAVSHKEESHRFIGSIDPGGLMIAGGSNVGLNALHIGALMGYRHFEVHGMDGCHRDGKRHAGEHYGKVQGDYLGWNVFGVQYKTSRIMANGVAEMMNHIEQYPILCVFHGHGLQQQLVRKRNIENACCADETEKAERIRKYRPIFVAAGPVEDAFWWEELRDLHEDPNWLPELQEISRSADRLRDMADYKTGSISLETQLLLRTLVARYRPKVVAEVGTFIGKSTRSLLLPCVEELHTCDRSNDVLRTEGRIAVYPRTTSTDMLSYLRQNGKTVDMFFFDGRIQPQDLPIILKLAGPDTVYLFDDFIGREKGVVNAQLLHGYIIDTHRAITPYQPWAGRTTLAALVPKR